MPEELTEQSKTLKEESLPTADDSVIEPTDPSDVFRRGVSDVMFERDTVIDVLSGLPDGHSIDQTLGVGLDGAPIDTARNHFGIGDDDLLAGRSINSPLGMTGDSLIDTSADTNNEAPPDIATGSSNPIHNMGLVSGEDGGTDDKGLVDTVVDTVNDWFSGKTTEPADAGTVRPEGDTPVPKPKPKGPVRPGSEDDYMTNPDADTGGTATDADIERAIAKQGADNASVEGNRASVMPCTQKIVTAPWGSIVMGDFSSRYRVMPWVKAVSSSGNGSTARRRWVAGDMCG